METNLPLALRVRKFSLDNMMYGFGLIKHATNTSKWAGWPQASAVLLLFLAISQDGAGVLIKDLNLHKIIWYLLYFGGSLLVVRLFRSVSPAELLKRNLLYLVLVGIALSSTLWTIDQISTIKRLFHLSGQLLLVLGIGYTLKNVSFIKFTYFCLWFNVALSLVVAMSFPEIGVGQYKGVDAWHGLTYNKNTLGMFASLCVIYSFFYYMVTEGRRHVLCAIVGAALSVFVVHKTDSATALICLALVGGYVVTLYLLSKTVRWFSFTVLFTPVFLALGIVLLMLVELRFADITELVGRSDTLTNRTEIWAESWELTLDKPLAGYGFGTIFYPYNDFAVYNHYEYFNVRHGDAPIVHAHNGFLTVSTQLGMPAAVIAIYIVLSMLFRNLYRYLKSLSLQSIVSSTLALFVFVYNFAEDTLFRPQDTLWTIFLVFLVMPVTASDHLHTGARLDRRKKHLKKKGRRKHVRRNSRKSTVLQ